MSSTDAPAGSMSGPTQKLEEMVNSTSAKLNAIWDEVSHLKKETPHMPLILGYRVFVEHLSSR
jgi:hypothetical protein